MVCNSKIVEVTEMFIDGEWVPISAAFMLWTITQLVKRVR